MLLAVILLVCWPVAEVYVAVRVAEAIGVLLTVVLILASWPIGSWALHSQGAAAWSRLTEAIAAGRVPGREVLDGAMVLVGGLLLMVPGFIADVLGAALLLAPARSLARRALARHFQSRMVRSAARPRSTPQAYDVDSTAKELDQPRLQP